MTAQPTLGIYRDSIGVGLVYVSMRGMGICSGDHNHVQFAASVEQVAERIGVTHPE